MNKRTLSLFLSLYIFILNTPASYGSYPAAAGAGAGALAGQPAQLSSQPKKIPSHITQLISQTYYPADRYPDAIAQVPAKRTLAQAAVKKYLDEGGDVNAEDESADRWTLLHYAAYNGNEVLATLLISRGANLEGQIAMGGSPLHIALHASEGNNRMPVVRVLIDAGADTNFITDKFEFIDHALGTLKQYSERALPSAAYIAQQTAKTRAAISQTLGSIPSELQHAIGDLVCGPAQQEDKDFGLLKYAISKSMQAPSETPSRHAMRFIISKLDTKPSLFIKQDECGYTLLSFAEYVQAKDAQTLIMDLQKQNAQHIKFCADAQQKKLADEQEAHKEGLKQASLANDAQAIALINDTQILNARYDHNKTALILAAEKGHEQVVDALLAKRANIALLDDAFNSALHYATQFGHKNVVQRLLKDIPLQGGPALMLREITRAHELAQKKEQEIIINKELYKQIKELLAPYLAQGQATAK